MAKVLGVDLAPVNVPFARRRQTFAVLYYIFVFFAMGAIPMMTFIYLFLFTSYYWIVLLYGIWLWYDKDTPKRGGRQFSLLRRSFMWKWFRDFFPINLHKTEDLDPSRNYIMGYHPHGIAGMGAWTNFGTDATDVSKKFPGLRFHLCTLVMNFYTPIRREYIMSAGCIDVSKESIEWCLTKQGKGGNAVIIVVGGAQEALDAHPGKFDITLNRRKGFVKMALKHGADLVPMFSFGENDVYVQVDNPEKSKLRQFQTWIKNWVGVSPPMFHGRGIFNYNVGMLPFRKPINTIVGRPIKTEKPIPEPTIDEINEAHQKYIEGLKQVFEENKKRFGVPDDTHLKIV